MTWINTDGKIKMTKRLMMKMPVVIGALFFLQPGHWQSVAQAFPPGSSQDFQSRMTASDRNRFLAITKTTATAIRVGHGRRKIWVYFNPDCSYCHRLWLSLDRVPDLTVYWIPVAFSLKSESLARSTAILSAGDPELAFEENEQRFDDLREQGGYPIPSVLPVQMKEKVTKNTMMLRLWSGTISTPTILFKDKRGRAQVLPGLPMDVPKMISRVSTGP